MPVAVFLGGKLDGRKVSVSLNDIRLGAIQIAVEKPAEWDFITEAIPMPARETITYYFHQHQDGRLFLSAVPWGF